MAEVIYTAAALDALPADTVLLDRDRAVWQRVEHRDPWRSHTHGIFTGTATFADDRGPFIVVHRPDRDAISEHDAAVRELRSLRTVVARVVRQGGGVAQLREHLAAMPANGWAAELEEAPAAPDPPRFASGGVVRIPDGPTREEAIRRGAEEITRAGILGADVAQGIAESAAEVFGLTEPEEGPRG